MLPLQALRKVSRFWGPNRGGSRDHREGMVAVLFEEDSREVARRVHFSPPKAVRLRLHAKH